MLQVARFAMRQSLRWSHVAPVAVVALVAVTADSALRRLQWPLLALFALVYAFPQAASRLIEADRDGRLNHLRLTGHPSGRLAAALALGWAGPWLAVGALATMAWIATRGLGSVDLLMIAATAGAAATLSLLALVLPRGETGADPRLVAVGLAFAALTTAASQALSIEAGTHDSAGTVYTALTLLTLEAALAAACLRPVLRIVARPASGAAPRRPPPRMFALRGLPIMARAFSLCSYPAMMMVVIVAAILALVRVWVPAPIDRGSADWLYITLMAYAPLPVGAFVISIGARGDRDSQRLELLRLSPARPVRVLAELALGVCIPFLLATLALHLVVFLMWGTAVSGIGYALLLALVLAPVAGLEGWKGQWPLIYLIPVGPPIAMALVLAAAFLRSPSWERLPNVLFFLPMWVPWAAALRTLRHPDRPPLSGWPGALAAFAIAAPLAWGSSAHGFAGGVAACLLILTGFVVDARVARRFDVVAPAAAASLAAVSRALGADVTALELLPAVPTPALVWWLSCRIHIWAGAADVWSAVLRLTLALLTVSGVIVMPALSLIAGPVPVGGDSAAHAAYLWRSSLAVNAVFFALLVIAEAAYRLWRRARVAQ